jgi:hypothetical protein
MMVVELWYVKKPVKISYVKKTSLVHQKILTLPLSTSQPYRYVNRKITSITAMGTIGRHKTALIMEKFYGNRERRRRQCQSHIGPSRHGGAMIRRLELDRPQPQWRPGIDNSLQLVVSDPLLFRDTSEG